MTVIDRRHWDGTGPINWLDRIESGPQANRLTCAAATTPAHGNPVECARRPGHPGGHMAMNRWTWAPRSWE